MKVVGSVKPDEVPGSPSMERTGLWTTLALKAIQAHHERGEVLVVTCDDRKEYRRMVNGMAEKISKLGYGRRFTAIDERDGTVRAYLGVVEKTPAASNSVAPAVLRRPRKRVAKP